MTCESDRLLKFYVNGNIEIIQKKIIVAVLATSISCKKYL